MADDRLTIFQPVSIRAANHVKKSPFNGADFIPAFPASNYADIQACRPRLKFKCKNNFTIATSIARSDYSVSSNYLLPRLRPPLGEYHSFAAVLYHNHRHRTDHRYLVHRPI